MTDHDDDESLSYSELKDKIKGEVEKHLPPKERVMLLAKKLEADLNVKETICSQICKDFEDVIPERYIRKCLPDEYKRKYNKPKEEEEQFGPRADIDHKKVIEVTAGGDANTQPYNSAKMEDETFPDDDDDAPRMPNLQQVSKDPAIADLERENKELKEAMEKMNLFNKASEIPATAQQQQQQEQPQVTEFYTSMEKFTLLNEWRYRGEKGWYSKVDPATNTVTSIEARSVRVRAETLAKLKGVKAK